MKASASKATVDISSGFSCIGNIGMSLFHSSALGENQFLWVLLQINKVCVILFIYLFFA